MRNKFKGFVDVFKFAYQQTVKTTAYKVTLIILCIVALASFPVMSLISGNDDETEKEQVTGAEHIGTIYIEGDFKEGALAKAVAEDLKKSDVYGNKEIVIIDEAQYEDTFKSVEKSTDGDVLVHIEYNNDMTNVNYGFMYSVYYGPDSKNVKDEASELSIYIDSSHQNVLTSIVAGSAEAGKYVSAEYAWNTMIIGEDGEIIDAGDIAMSLSQSEYWVTYAFLMIAIFSISIGGSRVGEQLVNEKANKVIEYIMTSVKPMALITGKVMASVASVFVMIGCVVVSFIASGLVNGLMFKNPDGSMAIPDILQAFLDIGVLNGASPLNIVILVLLFIGGFIFYGFLGGVAGATVSKVEEMAEGMKLFTFTMLIGAYIPLFLIMGGTMGVGDMGVFTDVIMILPISSVFITPAYILLGKVSTGIAAVALLVMVVCIVILMFLVSSIFESLIYYNGNPLKFKDLTKIFKDKRRAK